MTGSELLTKLKVEIEQEFLENLVPFWTEFAVDEVNGGFIGQVSYDNQKNYSADKGCILNARLVWAFSAAGKKFSSQGITEAAKRAYQYFIEHFLDREYGGFYWLLDSTGNVVDDRKHIYAQAFSIYGLVEYYALTKDREALKYAYQTFHLIEQNARDIENGGYFEAYSRKWELNEDVRLSDKDENEPKSSNTHLHILEAYTNLYRFAPDTQLKDRLEKTIHIFCDHIISSNRTSLINFMDEDWTPKSDTISYGHDIEASWLLTEAAKVLEDTTLLSQIETIALSLSTFVLENGVDSDGALLNKATPTKILDSDKDWWPQAEAIIGFLNAYEISKEAKYLEAALNAWEFIKSAVKDKQYGEWFEKVSRNGTPYSKLDKVRSWKGPYHNMRKVFEVMDRVERLTKETLVEVKAS